MRLRQSCSAASTPHPAKGIAYVLGCLASATFLAVGLSCGGSGGGSGSTSTVPSAAAPTITDPPKNTTVGLGATATFTVTANGTAPVTRDNSVVVPEVSAPIRESEVNNGLVGIAFTVV